MFDTNVLKNINYKKFFYVLIKLYLIITLFFLGIFMLSWFINIFIHWKFIFPDWIVIRFILVICFVFALFMMFSPNYSKSWKENRN